MEEENLHRNKQSVASLKVSAEAEIACNTEEEPQQQPIIRDTCQSRTTVEDTTRATEHSAASPDSKVAAAAAAMGEAASLKRAAGSVDGLLLEDEDRKKPAKQLKTKNSKDGSSEKEKIPQ